MTLTELKRELVKIDALLTEARKDSNKDISRELISDACMTIYMMRIQINEEIKNNGDEEIKNNAD